MNDTLRPITVYPSESAASIAWGGRKLTLKQRLIGWVCYQLIDVVLWLRRISS